MYYWIIIYNYLKRNFALICDLYFRYVVHINYSENNEKYKQESRIKGKCRRKKRFTRLINKMGFNFIGTVSPSDKTWNNRYNKDYFKLSLFAIVSLEISLVGSVIQPC
jgi:hypothetical protein